jgi:hypothetical protein
MPVNTTDQQITLPVDGDAADVPQSFLDQTADIESRLLKRYADATDRDTRNPTPNNGEMCFLSSANQWMRRHLGVWVPDPFQSAIRKASEVLVVNNSTAFVLDGELFLPLTPNTFMNFEAALFWDSGATADIKFDWSLVSGAGATMPVWGILGPDVGAAAGVGNVNTVAATAFGTTIARGGGGIGTIISAKMFGTVVVGANSGVLFLRWAQNALEAVNTRLKAGSWVKYDTMQ